MISNAGTLAAPFPWFGGKSGACQQVWEAFGAVDNYVEPFSGSAAMLLGAPDGKRIETINDADGFVANFWRAIAADPAYFDARIAGWLCWGACNWIGSGWCSGIGPWIHDGERIVNSRKLPHLGDAGQGINRQLPHLGDAGQGINRKLPHLGDAGRGINRNLPHLGDAGKGDRRAFIHEWLGKLHTRLRDVRVACGDWTRVVKDSVTTRHGLTGVFLDPPYTKGAMDYSAGGVGTDLPLQVQAWCAKNGNNPLLRIVLCGHAGEHDAIIDQGWTTRTWTARRGYALTDEAVANSASETLWCSPHCIQSIRQADLFAFA